MLICSRRASVALPTSLSRLGVANGTWLAVLKFIIGSVRAFRTKKAFGGVLSRILTGTTSWEEKNPTFNEMCNFILLYYSISKRNPSFTKALLCFIDEDKKELLEIIDSFKNSRAKIQNL